VAPADAPGAAKPADIEPGASQRPESSSLRGPAAAARPAR